MKHEQDFYNMPAAAAVGDSSSKSDSSSSSRSELSLETELRLGVGPPNHLPSIAKADSSIKGKQQIAQQQNSSIISVNPQISLTREGLIPQGYPAFLLGGMLESAAAAAVPASSSPSSSKYQGSSSYEHYYKNGTASCLPIKRGYSEANPASQLQSNSGSGGENKHSSCSWSNSAAPLVQSFGQTSAPATHQNDNRNHAGTVSQSRGAPVVGWPPVRSFRKSAIAAATTTVSAEPEKHAKKLVEEASPSSVAAVIPANPTVQNPTPQTLFVKANVDGVPIGRKIDLKAYSSYEGLKTALEEMFQPFMKETITMKVKESQRPQFKFLHGQDYVLTHQDKDGDWLFVGDVPWSMFISTVKRLRVMKTTEAIGLGHKPADPAPKILPSTSK